MSSYPIVLTEEFCVILFRVHRPQPRSIRHQLLGGDYWQCGFMIPKGSRDQLQGRGLPAFRDAVVQLAPFMADSVGELHDWEPIKLLTVQVDRLRQWYRPGLLCIGDAAHAMSPVGGVGINLAI